MPLSKEELDAMNAEADRKIQLEQIENGQSPADFAQEERAKWRWSGSVSRGIYLSAADLAADFNTGVTSLLGDDIQDALAGIGFGRFSYEAPRMGIIGSGAQATTQALGLAAGGAEMLTGKAFTQGAKLMAGDLNGGSMLRKIGADLAQTVKNYPKLFFGAEASGGFGSGAAMDAAQQAGAPPEAVPFAGIAGGLLGGAAPVGLVNFGRQAMNWSMRHVVPWFDDGEALAAARLQSLTHDPEGAAAKILKAPEGVTPGRASEDRNLMALESRIMEDDPNAAAEFAVTLDRARQIAQAELRDFSGNMRLPGEWERNVIEKVAAPGTVIKLGDPQTMLKQAKKSFAPVYKDFSGFPIKPHVETEAGDIPLDQIFKLSVADESILAADSERQAAAKILQDEFSRIKPSVDKDPTIDSEKLLVVRQMLRDKISDLTAMRKRGAHVTARILSNAEAAITGIFKQQLPPEAMQSLSQIDEQYNTYRIVEQAVITAGDQKLSATAVAKAIRQLSPRGAQDLRKAARAGRNIDSVLDDPRSAKLMVQGQPGNVRKQIQSDFFHSAWERSVTKDLSDGAGPLVSGERYLQHLVKYKDTAKALGIPPDEYNRAMEVAKTIKMMEAKSPAALRQTLEEGPATFMQLMATLVGAKWGTHLSKIGPGGGMGSSLVMSQFMSQRARRLLATRFRDDASDLLIAATKDRKLYAALLTKTTAKAAEQDKAARVIAAWSGNVLDEDLEAGGGGR